MESLRSAGSRLLPDFRPGDRGRVRRDGVLALVLPGLYVGMFLAMLSFRFIMSAYQGLMALIGRGETDVRTHERAVASRQFRPLRCRRICCGVHLRASGTEIHVSAVCRIRPLHRPIGILEAAFRIQSCLRQAAGQRHEPAGGRQAVGEASGYLSGSSDHVSMVFRARVEHSVAILSDR